MPVLGYLATMVVAYLLGSVPTGFLVAKARGVDIRTLGSGNIGATNVFRAVGKPAGVFVLLMDALKGFAAVALILNYDHELHDLLPRLFPAEAVAYPAVRLNQALLAGVFAILGHNYTCWLHFRGGKGIATSAGVYAALAPLAVALALGAWVLVFVLTRFVSVASLAAAVALPTAVWLTKDSVTLGVVTTALGLLAIAKHKTNIRRLRNGTENRVRFKGKAAVP